MSAASWPVILKVGTIFRAGKNLPPAAMEELWRRAAATAAALVEVAGRHARAGKAIVGALLADDRQSLHTAGDGCRSLFHPYRRRRSGPAMLQPILALYTEIPVTVPVDGHADDGGWGAGHRQRHRTGCQSLHEAVLKPIRRSRPLFRCGSRLKRQAVDETIAAALTEAHALAEKTRSCVPSGRRWWKQQPGGGLTGNAEGLLIFWLPVKLPG